MRTVGLGTPVRGSNESGAASWQGSVKDKDLTAPPGSPTLGDRYIVASPATGDWTGEEDNIAEWDGDAWICDAPSGGWVVYIDDEGEIYAWNGSSWGMESFGPHAATHKGGGSDEVDAATGSVAGLMSSTDKTKLDGVSSGAEKYTDRGDPASVDSSIGAGLTADGAWNTLNLSSIAPAAAASKLVHLRCRILDNSVETLMQIRKLGNTNAINATKAVTAIASDSLYFDAWVMLDADRKIQYNIESGMDEAEITVAGWMA